MDISKDSLTARAQRLQERNVSKDRSTSTSEEMEEGRDDKTFPRSTATTSDDPRSLWKPPLLEMEEERDDKKIFLVLRLRHQIISARHGGCRQ